MYPIGAYIEDIQTPALLLDLDKFQWNVDKMFKFAKETGVNVRPHAKTFKAAAICNKLIEAGAIGIMTQKLGEAEVLLNSGILYGDKNILISQELSDPAKIEKLEAEIEFERLGEKIESLKTAIQSFEGEIEKYQMKKKNAQLEIESLEKERKKLKSVE